MLADLLARADRFLWWTVRPRYAGTFSRFLRSACCDAPVRQRTEMFTDLLVASCARCGTELGAPGREDVDPREPTPFDQWGCGGTHRGDGSPGCPREPHHHHDRRCLPPVLVQADEACRPGVFRVEVNGIDVSQDVTNVTLPRFTLDDEGTGRAW